MRDGEANAQFLTEFRHSTPQAAITGHTTRNNQMAGGGLPDSRLGFECQDITYRLLE
jgi:hypothetical protein